MNTIVVDDDFTCRCWLKGVLRKIGFQVVSEAANGQEAVQAVTTHHPDLVLLDVSMPVKTGPEALPEILAAHPKTLVVMLTSIADEATVVDCLEKGAVDYLRKDATIEEIHQTLSSLQPTPHPTR
jgi:two-component system chemotaxis response regulator CheY